MRFGRDKRWLQSELSQDLALTAVVVLSYLLGRCLRLEMHREWIQLVMLAVSVPLCLYLILDLILQKRPAGEHICVILFLGFLFRIGYMMYTPCDVRSHDLLDIDREGMGHAGYLLRLLETGKLPETNYVQLYQQPFYYMTAALFSKGINGLLGCSDPFWLVDAAKTVSCAASCISLVCCRRMCRECGVGVHGQEAALMLASFLPSCYLTGGRVTPDALAAMLMAEALLYTLRWQKKSDWRNTVILAVIYGCGVMTKISCGVVALITAMAFLVTLIRNIRKGTEAAILCKLAAFGVISLPLGLWYGIRNYLKFRQPLMYVLMLPESHPIYTGDHSLLQRLAGFDVASLLRSPYVSVSEDYNMHVYALKSALFGEVTYSVPSWIPLLLLLCGGILSGWTVAACIWQIRKNRKDRTGNFLLLSGILFYCSMMWFYTQYPFACSMDFRYMTFLLLPLGGLLGKYVEGVKKHRMWIFAALAGYMAGSCLQYCLI